MARISFTADIKQHSNGPSFPKLKLDKDESARIVCLEEPVREYVHTLEEPVIVNGRGEKKTYDRKDGSTYEKWLTKYVKHFLCVGDEGALEESGVDVVNCPACKASTQMDEIKPPKTRYAMNIIKYNVKPGTAEVTNTFGVNVIAWVFGDQQFGMIRKLALEGWKLQEHDLILGPCTDAGYQKFSITPSQNVAAWMASDANKKHTKEVFGDNKTDDLTNLIAPSLDISVIKSSLERVQRGWDIVNGRSAASPVDSILASVETKSLTDSLSDLGDSVKIPADPGSAQETDSLSNLLADLDL
jgi:hypothetical protein